jgi:threonine dehydratase
MFSLAELESVIPLVRQSVLPTPQYAWPLLRERLGADVVVKHENYTPVGSFKVRGGIVFFDRLKRRRPEVRGIISATRGNHGQSLAFAGARAGVAVTIVVPRGNSTEKNAAMCSFGAELIEHGRDFDEAREYANRSQRNGVSNLLPRSTAILSLALQRTRTNYSRRPAILTLSTCRSDWDPESAV